MKLFSRFHTSKYALTAIITLLRVQQGLDCYANSKMNGHRHGETTPNWIMRHSGISDILERRPCPEPEYNRPRPSMARRPTRAVTRIKDVDESSTQSGTGETPPAGTSATTQLGEGATPPVDPEY